MASELTDYIRSKRRSQEFRSVPYYSQEGDFLTLFLRNEDHYAKRVDSALTLYLSMKSNQLVGCKIKGVRRILETFGRLELTRTFHHSEGEMELELRVLLAPGMALASDEEQVEHYDQLEAAVRDIRIDKRELQPS